MDAAEKHVFRNPDKVPVLPYREWARENLPHSRDGMVVEDIDMILRTWGPNHNTGPFGKIRLLEIKHGNNWPTAGQMLTFKGIDELLRRADPTGEVYQGFYIVKHFDADWKGEHFIVNSEYTLTQEEFKLFCLGQIDLPGYDFSKFKMPTKIQLH
jgi:hypothetical protein